MFSKILIANRGEIACRVIRTCRKLAVATVAVFSEADAHALHVAMADQAYPIGPAPARRSYLVIDNIIEAARRSGAEAIHPGYGFLSENPAFAEACAAAGIVFIGPPASAMRAMGSKAAAKALMARAGVPLVPGYHGEAQDAATLTRAADEIGYPVLIKASAGGGGKGMRIVETPGALAAALEGARAEAAASFGDDRLLIERYLSRPRHIEIQVFADTQGNCISLYERDCSIQRRHQKIIEEAPAPGLDPARRAEMGAAAVAAAKAVGYVGAGTVEFIAAGDMFHFMEMNTRLQVEHPVTEMITGLDLVEWQLRIAAGEALPTLTPRMDGHAIEARIYAEDPARDFLPSIGTITHLREPPGARIDTGIREGDRIPPDYDPMIAKLIVHGPDRATAVRRLSAALAAYEVAGVQTNLALLRAIAGHPAFAAADLDTGFLTRHAPTPPEPDLAPILAAAALSLIPPAGDDPWSLPDVWRLGSDRAQELKLDFQNKSHTLRLSPKPDGTVQIECLGLLLAICKSDPDALTVDGIPYHPTVLKNADQLTVILSGTSYPLRKLDPLTPPDGLSPPESRLIAPIPARVSRVLAAIGDHVTKGTVVLVLEAMKMEIALSAPRDGTVATLRYAVGDLVEEGTELITFKGTVDSTQ